MSRLDVKAIVEINQAASSFASSIVLQTEDKIIDVKSIIGLSVTLMPSVAYKLNIHGSDEEQAKAKMAELFEKHGLKYEIV